MGIGNTNMPAPKAKTLELIKPLSIPSNIGSSKYASDKRPTDTRSIGGHSTGKRSTGGYSTGSKSKHHHSSKSSKLEKIGLLTSTSLSKHKKKKQEEPPSDEDSEEDAEDTEEDSDSDDSDETDDSSVSEAVSRSSNSTRSSKASDLFDRIIREGHKNKRDIRRSGIGYEFEAGTRHRSEHITDEQVMRSHIDEITNDLRGSTNAVFRSDYERMSDNKLGKLEQIGRLKDILTSDGHDLSGIPDLNKDSGIVEIDTVLAVLRMKNDRIRCSTLTEDVLVGLAEVLESTLDGETEIPILGWTPDYTGYRNSVSAKLHRMQFETSQVVGDMIEKMGISDGARVVLELLPGFLMYPKISSREKAKAGRSVPEANRSHAILNDAKNKTGKK
jgi:hypothetical protein